MNGYAILLHENNVLADCAALIVRCVVCLSVCLSSVIHVLWLNGYGTSCGSAMVPLDEAMTSSCRLSIVNMSICSGLAAILNAKLLPTAITRITELYPNVNCSV